MNRNTKQNYIEVHSRDVSINKHLFLTRDEPIIVISDFSVRLQIKCRQQRVIGNTSQCKQEAPNNWAVDRYWSWVMWFCHLFT